jgi:hypothetical protein
MAFQVGSSPINCNYTAPTFKQKSSPISNETSAESGDQVRFSTLPATASSPAALQVAPEAPAAIEEKIPASAPSIDSKPVVSAVATAGAQSGLTLSKTGSLVQLEEPPSLSLSTKSPAKQPSKLCSKLLKIAAVGASGLLLGTAMATGGIGGMVCGVLAGTLGGVLTFGTMANRSRSDGELLGGLAGIGATAIAGGVAGAFGIPEGGLLVGGTMALIQGARSFLKS